MQDEIDPYHEVEKHIWKKWKATLIKQNPSSAIFNTVHFPKHISQEIRNQSFLSFKSLSPEQLDALIMQNLMACESRDISDRDKMKSLQVVEAYLCSTRLLLPHYIQPIMQLFIINVLNTRISCYNIPDIIDVLEPDTSSNSSILETIYLLYCEICLHCLTSDEAKLEICLTHIDKSFAEKLLEHLQTSNVSVRFLLKQILYAILTKLKPLRKMVVIEMQNYVVRINSHEIESCYGVAEMLEIFASMIQNYKYPLLKSQNDLLLHVLLPLYHHTMLPLFASQLTNCMQLFIIVESRLSSIILSIMMLRYHNLNSQHEIYLLKSIEEILTVSQLSEILPLTVKLISKLKTSLISQHSIVSETSLNILNNLQLFELFEAEPQTYLPIFYWDLVKVSKKHWNKRVRDRSLVLMRRLDYIEPTKYTKKHLITMKYKFKKLK